MQHDYYTFQTAQLSDRLHELEQAAAELEQAKKQRDKNARQRAEDSVKQAAQEAVQIEPHLSYLWYEAQGFDLKNSIRDVWQKRLTASTLPDAFHFTSDISVIDQMPPLSFMLCIPFKLRKPYLSKDDCTFHLLDNPVRKEKVFQTPMVASTSWKGALRATLWQLGHKEDDKTIIRLFGNPRESEAGQAGRLYFYPTFFNQIGLEVINPHERKTGVGSRGPILMECVPAGATSEFILLYVPFGSEKQSDADRRAEVAEDLELIAEGVRDMLTIYGFGAKTSSGFGVADVDGEGKLALRADLPDLKQPEPQATPPEPTLPRYLIAPGQLHPDFQNSDGSLKSEAEYKAFVERQKQPYSKKVKQLYEKAQKWWEREGRQLAETATLEPAPEPPPPQKLPFVEKRFDSLKTLLSTAEELAQSLKEV